MTLFTLVTTPWSLHTLLVISMIWARYFTHTPAQSIHKPKPWFWCYPLTPTHDRCSLSICLTKSGIIPIPTWLSSKHKTSEPWPSVTSTLASQDSKSSESSPGVTPTQAFSRQVLPQHLSDQDWVVFSSSGKSLSWWEAGTASPHDRLPIPAYMGCHSQAFT